MTATPAWTTNGTPVQDVPGDVRPLLDIPAPARGNRPPHRTTGHGGTLDLRLDRPTSDTTVLAVRGDVDTSTVRRLRELLWHRLASCTGTVVLDLSAMTFVNTSGLHLLEQCQRRAEEHDISFRVVRDDRGLLARLLDLADAHVRFLVHPDLNDALAPR
ncbi:STAS domain-containing protein [Saccharopolyspora gloriosae]|uniref:STAS domain-containing protein n=1 Tax=Saccharopolyspora gloriosae TaxID=455344 RepID=UPI001FB626F1|nr:STAS domain-containing protein [Saccharopolyspora gloriosae]